MDKKQTNNHLAPSGINGVRQDRRNFIVRSGIAATVAAVAPTLALKSQEADATLLASTGIIKAVLNALTKDTFAGVVAFMLPGNDGHSFSQGEYYWFKEGGLATDADDFMVEGFNTYMAMPDNLTGDALGAIADAFDDVVGPLPAGVALLLNPLEQWVMKKLEEHIAKLLSQNEHIPLAHVFSLLLNVMASRVNPWATGLQISPFARLSWSEKAEVFRIFETELPDILANIASKLTGEMDEKISGLIRFAAGATLQFAAFGPYSEWQVYDPENRELIARPYGWDMSNYMPDGPVEGWDEFIGYYQGRTSVDA